MDSHKDASFCPCHQVPWNKNQLIGPKTPLKLREIWAVRIRLQLRRRIRDLALFNLALDTRLRGCDLVSPRVRDATHSGKATARASIVQQKTRQFVKFELTEQTRDAVEAWIAKAELSAAQHLFPSRQTVSPHTSMRNPPGS